MIVVVADSGPVRYLAVLNAIGVLPKLYDRIILPRSVVEELSHPHAPVEAREWAGNLPSWAEVRQARQIGLAAVLDAGEAEAIAIAEELRADLVLLDEHEARKIASERGLAVAGTIGVLEQAAARELIELPEVLRRLIATNFRIAPAVIEEALERDRVRREQQRAQKWRPD